MARYKGRRGPKVIKRDYPHAVELPVPENGFGNQLDVIHLFHIQLAIDPVHGPGRREDGQDYVTWCFADPQHAGAFQGLFGGETKVAAN